MTNSSKRENLFDKSLSDMNVLGSNPFQLPNSGVESGNNILHNISDNQVEEMKRITKEFKNNFKKGKFR